MASAHSLRGSMNGSGATNGATGFAEESMTPICSPPANSSGVDIDEVVSILGEHFFTTTVWGSAFEDFLTPSTSMAATISSKIILNASRLEGERIDAGLHDGVTSICAEPVRSQRYRQRHIVPARDPLRGGDPLLINERSATRSLKQWDRIVARCSGWLTCADQRGGVAIRTRCIGERFEVFAMLRSAPIRRRQKLADQVGLDANYPAIVNALSHPEVLRAAAPTITTIWLIDTIVDMLWSPRYLWRTTPKAKNYCSALSIIRWPADVTLDDIRLALNRAPSYVKKVRILELAEFSGNQIKSPPRPKDRQPPTLSSPSMTARWGPWWFGIEGKSLVLSVNSRGRSDRAALCCPSCSAAWWASPWSKCKR